MASATFDASASISSGGTLYLRMWVYDNSKPIRGVIVCTPGIVPNGSDGRAYYTGRTMWRTVGQAHDFAIIGLYFSSSSGNPNSSGGLQALINGLNSLATNSGHSEVRTVPICPYGFSGGGCFSVLLTQYVPTRVIAFAHNKGACISSANFSGIALGVPGFITYGENDTSRITAAINAFTLNRGNHALWALFVDLGQGHNECCNAEPLAVLYFDQLIERRLPAGYIPGSNYTLVVLDENSGLLGNNDTITVSSHASYNGNVYTASWLPNQTIADSWVRMQGGKPSPCNNPTGSLIIL